MKVQELITRELYTAQPGDTLHRIEARMAALNVHALPIIDEEGKALGIVTSSDLSPDIRRDAAIADLISDVVYQIDVEEDAKEAARMMRDQGVHHLVATEGGRAVGMVSSFDLLRVIVEG